MTRVDFYVLQDGNSPDQFTCSIVNKAFQQGLPVHVHAESKDAAQRLDDLMWTFRDISFLPHALADGNSDPAQVSIGWDGSSRPDDGVLVNLGVNIPEFAGSFARIIEIVAQDDPARTLARERYRRYRELGFELHNHEIAAKDAGN